MPGYPLSLAQEPERDCLHWLPEFLDREQETCWCLKCGDELPCSCRPVEATSIPKELITHV